MNKLNLLLIPALAALASLAPSAQAQDAPNAEQILQSVRHSSAQNEELTLEGRLRVAGGQRHPFRMTIRPRQIAFLFEEKPQHSIVLDLGSDSYRLRERHGTTGPFTDVGPEQYGHSLRDTGVNYLDISLAYLYWPNPKLLEEDVVAERLTWKLELTNPGREGPYAKLHIWVDQNTRGLMRMQGYDAQGRLVKKMEARDVQRVESGEKKVWALKKMTVTAYDPQAGRVLSRTYLEL